MRKSVRFEISSDNWDNKGTTYHMSMDHHMHNLPCGISYFKPFKALMGHGSSGILLRISPETSAENYTVRVKANTVYHQLVLLKVTWKMFLQVSLYVVQSPKKPVSSVLSWFFKNFLNFLKYSFSCLLWEFTQGVTAAQSCHTLKMKL